MTSVPSNYAEARAAADKYRDIANRIHDRIKTEVQDAILKGTPNGRRYAQENFAALVDRLCKQNTVWQSSVAKNQWMISYATMYAQGEILEKLGAILKEYNPA